MLFDVDRYVSVVQRVLLCPFEKLKMIRNRETLHFTEGFIFSDFSETPVIARHAAKSFQHSRW